MHEYDLERFVKAQANAYQTALEEIKNGQKRSHWMWYIFPQLDGLGFSSMAQYYGISGLQEAAEYLKHKLLGARLIEISQALLMLETNDATKVFSWPDNMKLKSSMTLFAQVENAPAVFQNVIDKFFAGVQDEKTLEILSGK